ncbi:phage tail protein [Vibrio quintilis]|uniref:Phage P2 GpU n=1 Tax=Vibrio quintilis TaxID=1117707 RepID=A0A1M7YZC4_9VIBR|nr:phage tail protein [Vibrio quintilis]SHO57786.1 Phage P2 GpU [Vibrio quintilis]
MTTDQDGNQQSSNNPNVVMMKLGDFSFSVETAAYQSMKRDFSFEWKMETVGKIPGLQFVTEGAYKRSLSGVIYPEYKGGFSQIDSMAALARTGRPLRLLMGSTESKQAGINLGFWCITSISETATIFHRNGRPRKLEFSMGLVYYGNKYPDPDKEKS